MSKVIAIKIDVTKIEKERLYVGEKGTYLDAVLIPTENNEYGNSHMIVQSVSKEEREAGTQGPILGNAKQIGQSESKPATQETPTDLPF